MTMRSLPRFLHRCSALALVAVLVLTGCGGGGESVQIEKGERSPAIEGAQARFASPADTTVVDSSNVHVVVNAEGFEPGIQTDTDRKEAIANSGNGQHFHVIVDNGPYYANYEAGTPFPIGTLSDGAHTAFVFPSRSYHESVKGTDAYDVVRFYVNTEDGEFTLSADAPSIIYSRPKGTYAGAAAERIMLDFYLHNVELGPDSYTAKYTITKQGASEPAASISLNEWTPAFVTGLSSGTYQVRLQLLDAEGNVVDGSWNDTTREIEVESMTS